MASPNYVIKENVIFPQVQLVLRVQALQDRQEHARDGGQLRHGLPHPHAAHPTLLQHRQSLRQGKF